MAGKYKRKLEDFDPNKSDSEDLDYDAKSPPRPQTKSRKHTSSRKPPKRPRREAYGDTSDDIEADSDGESDEGSFAESNEPEEVELNPRTGRSVRNVAKKPVTYEEESEEEEVDDESEPDPLQPTPARRQRVASPAQRESLVLKLKIPSLRPESDYRRSRKSSASLVKQETTPKATSATAMRRSSRISHDEEAPLVALTDSGRHEVVTRAGTATPDPPSSRRSARASKGLKKLPSAIMEASQEDSQQRPLSEAENEEAVEIGDLETLVARTTGDEEELLADAPQADESQDEIQMDVVQESVDEDEEAPVAHGGRSLRARRKASTPPASQNERSTRRSLRQRKPGVEQSSDFEPDAEGEVEDDEDVSDSDALTKQPLGSSNDESQGGRRSGRISRKPISSQGSRSRRHASDDEADEDLDPDEIADEAADLAEDSRRNRRPRRRPANRTEIAFEPNLRTRGQRPDYRILRPELLLPVEDDDGGAQAATPQRRRGGGGAVYRSLFSTAGPFGGLGGPPPVFGGPDGQGATGGVDSDSSDDDMAVKAPQNVGGTIGMTPTSAFPKPYVTQTHNTDPAQGSGGPAGLGKVKDRKALADADPLGVDPNVGFESVGGLDDHIDRLKEMVALPLLYPEVFQRFHVTPPRGVLFHGPPGTGKTLLARALASSVSSHGKKVTFYMRKGADALSKWVGEAEKQLRLLFDEARKNQPSIIFFDEIDGLAPVRSSKQEQIHASIVATLLALMDGMDGRGQVIVIGATNRPDSVDPALRRPGRFDREFYFPLPSLNARRAIIDIHTKGWDPPLVNGFKDELAELTKGYGGADLRALCTEAALNAVQGTYPQIYSSDKKLIIDPSTIKVLAKDFMISVNKIIPSSERSAASGAVPLKKDVEPLLRKPLQQITNIVEKAIPRKRKATALEEAMFDDREDEFGFERETMQRQFESSRVFRPRLLIKGLQGMGQQYLGAALLSKLEGLHVQNFGLSVLLSDSSRSPEAAVIQLFEEVKRHKPSVIYIPHVNNWYRTLSDSAVRTFTGLLKSLPPTEPVLLLGILEYQGLDEDLDPDMLRDLFGYSLKSHFELQQPDKEARKEFFHHIISYIRKAPSQFPDPEGRKRRKLIDLPVAEEEPQLQIGPSKADLKAQKKKDRQTLNLLKLNIQQVMDQIKLKYRKFRTPIVEDSVIGYLYDEQDPHILTTDLAEQQRQEQQVFRPYEIEIDEKGAQGLREVASGKFYYNLEIVTIEKRLSNGYYKRPKDFLADIKRLAKDAKMLGDQDRTFKANEMLANVEVDMTTLETQQPALVAECEAVFVREQQREAARLQKVQEAQNRGEDVPLIMPNVPPHSTSKTSTDTTGPVTLGQEVPGMPPVLPLTPSRIAGPNSWSNSNGVTHQANGSTVPSRPHEDSDMYDASQESVAAHVPGQESMPTHGSPEQQNTQGQRSQKSAHTQLAHGSQLEQYHNSASTTSSGNKTSDRSNRSSGPYSVNTQQQSNGTRDHPDFATLPPTTGGSQLPDTQSSQSQPASQSSQQMAPPPQRPVAINALLNESEPSSIGGKSDPPTHLITDEANFAHLHSELVLRSSGLSVEQLEQVQASLMEALWQTRREWNRVKVSKTVEGAFNEVIRDIEACQKILKASQET